VTQQIINVGAAINDGTGDPARTAFTKSNNNFTELYAVRPAPFDALAYNGMQINGSMEVSQERGATATTTTATYVVDGFRVDFNAPGMSAAQSTNAPPGFVNSIMYTVGTATPSLGTTDICRFLHRIEGYRFSRLAFGTAAAQPLTIGFWTRIHRPGMYSGSLRNGALNRSYAFAFTQNVADAWEYKVVTIPGDTTGTWTTDNSVGASLGFVMAVGSSGQTAANVWTAGSFAGVTGTTNGVAATTDTFQITGVVILPGSDAPSAACSPFIMRPYNQELQTCQRYFWAGRGVMGIRGYGSIVAATMSTPVSMRAVPTVTKIGTWSTSNAGQPGFLINGPDSIYIYTTVSAPPGEGVCVADSLSLGLNADARL
jgi:hypothetical protein